MWYNASQKLSSGRIGARQHYRLRGCGIFLQPFLCCVYGMGISILNSRWGASSRSASDFVASKNICHPHPLSHHAPRRAAPAPTSVPVPVLAPPHRQVTSRPTPPPAPTPAPVPARCASRATRTRSRTLPTRRTRNRTRSCSRRSPFPHR